MPIKVVIKKSTNPKKKLMAVFYKHAGGPKIKTTHFGSAGMDDFTKTRDEAQKKRYISRHRKRENWQDYMSAGALSRWILWDKPTRSGSIKAYKNRFNLV
tara:strand:+ start:296 stop:595 length:300 start_codon:yes stop_codon:yes gene_type:complete